MIKQAKTVAKSVDVLFASHPMPRLEEGGGGFDLGPPSQPAGSGRVAAFALSFVALFLSLFAGYRLIGSLLGPPGADPFLSIALIPGAGFAFTALCLSLSLFLFSRFSVPALVLLHAGTLFLPVARAEQEKSTFPARAAAVYAALIALSVFLTAAKLFKSPYGSGVDVWAIWHYKARLIFRHTESWRAIFSPLADFSHQDYPLFYPLGVVWGWLVSGRETVCPSWLLSFIFTVSTAGILFSVWAQKHLWKAAGAAFLVLSTPHFVGMGTSQYADIFTAYFDLAAAVLLSLSFEREQKRLAAAAGFFAGAGLYVKNEGILFFLALLISIGVAWFLSGKQRSFYAKAAFYCVIGALPMGLLTFWFKMIAFSPNDVISWSGLLNLTDLPLVAERAGTIGHFWLREIFEENAWVYAWFLFPAVLAAAGASAFSRRNAWLWCLILLLNAGYFAVYLMTPHQIAHHLEHSLDRVMIHGYPLMIFAVFEAWRA